MLEVYTGRMWMYSKCGYGVFVLVQAQANKYKQTVLCVHVNIQTPESGAKT